MMTTKLHHIVNNPFLSGKPPTPLNFHPHMLARITSRSLLSSISHRPQLSTFLRQPKATGPVANMSSGAGEKGTFKPIDEAQSQKLPG